MRNEIRFMFANETTINAISNYHFNLHEIDRVTVEYREKIKTAQGKIDEISAKISNGDASAETASALATAESAKKALADAKRQTIAQYSKSASKNAEIFCPDEVLNAFIVAVEKGSVTATGSVTFSKSYKSGKVVETTYKTNCGLANAIGKWLARIGISDADKKSVKKLAEYIMLTSPLTKKQNIAQTGEYLKTVKGGAFTEAIMRAFFQYMVVRTNQFVTTDDGHLEPKKAEVKFESVSVDELF